VMNQTAGGRRGRSRKTWRWRRHENHKRGAHIVQDTWWRMRMQAWGGITQALLLGGVASGEDAVPMFVQHYGGYAQRSTPEH